VLFVILPIIAGSSQNNLWWLLLGWCVFLYLVI